MAFVGFEDLTGKTELLVFPRTFVQFREALVPDAIAVVSARVARRKRGDGKEGKDGEDGKEGKDDEEVSLIVNSLVLVEDGEVGALSETLRSGGWIDEEQRRKFQAPKGKIQDKQEPSVSIALRGRPTHEMVERLRAILKANPGGRRVCLLVESGGQTRKIETEYAIHPDPAVVDEIAAIVGRQNVSC
jgi:DNA polymerase III alpha subunit